MTEGWAIIISAIITVGGMALTQFFNYIQRKSDFNKQLLFDAYQKRLELYEDVIKILQDLNIHQVEKIIATTSFEVCSKILVDTHLLSGLLARIHILGSADAAFPIKMLYVSMLDLIPKYSQNPVSVDISVDIKTEIQTELISLNRIALTKFIETVSKETWTDFVKENASIKFKNSTGKTLKNKPRRNDDGRIQKHKRKRSSSIKKPDKKI